MTSISESQIRITSYSTQVTGTQSAVVKASGTAQPSTDKATFTGGKDPTPDVPVLQGIPGQGGNCFCCNTTVRKKKKEGSLDKIKIKFLDSH